MRNCAGTIPTGVGGLSSLQTAWLGYNSFSGIFRSFVVTCFLTNLALLGSLPSTVGALSSIKFFSIPMTNLNGADDAFK